MSTIKRSHQTAVFVRVTDRDSKAYRNRIDGLVGSLNRSPNYSEGGTIKADFYAVNDDTGEITRGVSFPAKTPVLSAAARAEVEAAGYTLTAPAKVTGGRVSSPSLRRQAADAGYVLTLVVEPSPSERG